MEDEALLQAYGIRPTAIRLLIVNGIKKLSSAFSLDELYEYLETVDRSTVFRTVVLFEKHKLLHGFDDGMGRRKYCLCLETDHPDACHLHNVCHHAHITCRICGRTFCLPSEHTPHVHTPQDFVVEDVNYVVTGVCGECRKRGVAK